MIEILGVGQVMVKEALVVLGNLSGEVLVWCVLLGASKR